MTDTYAIVKRWGLRAASLILAGTAAIGLLHLPAAKPVLALLARATGCPVPLDGGDPAKIEAMRAAALGNRVGDQVERARPALRFQLGVTRSGQVAAWLGSADCTWLRARTAVRCDGLRKDGVVMDLFAQFDATSRLVALDVFRTTTNADAAVTQLDAVARSVARQAGDVREVSVQAGAARDLVAPYARVGRELAYRTYVAKLSAVNLGSRGFRVREQYQWLPSTDPG